MNTKNQVTQLTPQPTPHALATPFRPALLCACISIALTSTSAWADGGAGGNAIYGENIRVTLQAGTTLTGGVGRNSGANGNNGRDGNAIAFNGGTNTLVLEDNVTTAAGNNHYGRYC